MSESTSEAVLAAVVPHWPAALRAIVAARGMAVRKADTALRDDLNRAIKAIRANGTYQKINAKYFDYDIFGG